MIAERTKDVEGIAGQVRKFNLDVFLRDSEKYGVAIPGALGDHCAPPRDETNEQKVSKKAPSDAKSTRTSVATFHSPLTLRLWTYPG